MMFVKALTFKPAVQKYRFIHFTTGITIINITINKRPITHFHVSLFLSQSFSKSLTWTLNQALSFTNELVKTCEKSQSKNKVRFCDIFLSYIYDLVYMLVILLIRQHIFHTILIQQHIRPVLYRTKYYIYCHYIYIYIYK